MITKTGVLNLELDIFGLKMESDSFFQDAVWSLFTKKSEVVYSSGCLAAWDGVC